MQELRSRRWLNAVLAGAVLAVAAGSYTLADVLPGGAVVQKPGSLLPSPTAPADPNAGAPTHPPSRGSTSVRAPIGPWLGEPATADRPVPTRDESPTNGETPSPEASLTPDESQSPTESPLPTGSPAPTPDPTATPTESTPPPAPPPPPPPPAISASCAAIPAEPAGWTRRVTSAFSETVGLGSWPGPVAAQDWFARQAGATDSSGRGTYNADKTVTEHSGVLDVFIHSEGNTRYIAALVAALGDTVGQRITVCMRADRIPGYKLAFLLWPGQGNGNDRGEIDFPEGKLDPSGTAHAFMHYDPKPASDPKQDGWDTGVSTADWHVYTIEWDPGTSSQSDDVCAFYLDGQLVGRSTGAPVPDGPMHYVMQMETYLAGQALPPPASGHVLIDWITIATPS